MTATAQQQAPDWTRQYPNLASARLGARALTVSDEWFAPRERLLDDAEAVFIPGKYDDHGKWMDGWETRRKRVTGHDWCIVRLAVPGMVYGVDIDTSHFTGNFPPAASIDGCCLAEGGDPDADTVWQPLLAAVSLGGDAHHFHVLDARLPVTHVRLNIFPDGGVARLRVHGRALAGDTAPGAELELSSMLLGGRIVACNNSHYGPPHALLAPGRGVNMGDGWETRRRREPGNDWVIVELARPGRITRIEVDTAHFKGNYPDACSLQAACVAAGTDQSVITQSMFWPELLPAQKLSADAIHHFDAEALAALGPVTHVRFNIHPDGGVSRLRVFGRVESV